MLTICTCDGTNVRNTNIPTCFIVPAEVKKLIAVKKFDETGALNSIPAGTVLDDAFVTAKINNTNPEQRWFPIGDFETVDQEQGDAIYQDNRDQSQYYLGQGAVAFTGILSKYPTGYKAVLDSYRCGEWAFYEVDRNGVLWGYATDMTAIYPRPIATESASSKFMREVQNTSVPALEFTFQWAVDTDDSCIVTDTTATANFKNVRGLLDGYAVKSTGAYGVDVASATEYSFDAKTAYGSSILGLLTGDFVLTNTTTDLVVAATSVETPNGFYTHTIAAQTTGDIMQLTGFATGYDLAPMGNVTFEAL